MKKLGIITILFICLLFTYSTGHVVADNVLSVYGENDSRLIKPNGKTDRHYTHGGKLVYLAQPHWQWLEDFSNWDAAGTEQAVDTAVGFFIGQNIYTPDNPGHPSQRKSEDMYFAGWLYGGMFVQRATNDVLEHIELNVGVIGPSSKAEEVQDEIHEWLRSDKPEGWENQISDEPAADFTYVRQYRITDGPLKPTDKTDVIAEYGFTAGSVHRHVQAGLTFRYGFNLGNTFGPGRMNLPSGISIFRKKTDKSGYFFARFGARAVEYNRFLTGLSPEPLVGELQIGAVYTYKSFEIGYSQTFFTQEFKEQSGKDSLGTVSVSYLF